MVSVDGGMLIEEYGILLQSARGPVPNLPELVVGERIRGSWWAHPDHDHIFKMLNEAMIPGLVVRMRLIGGKVTLVHRRLWPAIVKLADQFDPQQLAVLEEEHSVSGAHSKTIRPFPEWVPHDVLMEATKLSYGDAVAQLPECLRLRAGQGQRGELRHVEPTAPDAWRTGGSDGRERPRR